MRNELRRLNLKSFLAKYFVSKKLQDAVPSGSIRRSLTLEPLESRQLLSSVSLVDDGSELSLVSPKTDTADSTDRTSASAGLAAESGNLELSEPLSASGTGLDLTRTTLNGGSLNNYFQSVSYYQNMKQVNSGDDLYLRFLGTSKTASKTVEIAANKAVNIVLQPTNLLLDCTIVSVSLLDSTGKTVSTAEPVIQDGVTLYYFPTLENYETQKSYSIVINRQTAIESQLCYSFVYESDISTAGNFAEIEGHFAASSSAGSNTYTYSLSGNSSSSICVYAPESHNVTVELYNSSGTQLAKAVNQGDGYYSIPCFVNTNGQSQTFTIKINGGGSGIEEKYELTVSQDAGVASGAGNTLSTALDLASFRKLSTSTSVVLGSVNASSDDFAPSKKQISLPTGVSSSDYFGSSIDYSDGYLVVGSPKNSSGGMVSLYTPNLNDSGWTFLKNIAKPSSATSSDFGTSVSISGQWIAVGSPSNKVSNVSTGSAFVYSITSNAWQQLDTSAFQSALASGASFGQKVQIEGDWLFVQSKNDKSDTSDLITGSVYVYHLDSSGHWNYIQKLVGEIDTKYANFGCSIACDGQTLAIGASGDSCLGSYDGSVTIYTLNGDRWKQTQKILLDSVSDVNLSYVSSASTAGISFGCSVALNNGTLAVGASGYNYGGSNGIVAVFEKSADNQWVNTDTLLSTERLTDGTIHAFSNFGASLDIAQDTIVVGCNMGEGAIYLYRLDPSGSNGASQSTSGTWELTNIIDGSNLGGEFASNILIAGDRLVVTEKPDTFSNGQDLYSYSELAKTDYYSFTLGSQTATISLTPQNEATLADFDVYFLDANGNRLYANGKNALTYDSSKGVFQATISPTYWAKGVYYVCVRSNTGSSGDYILELKNGNAVSVTGETLNVVDGGYMTELPSEIVFQFADTINLTSLSSAIMTIGTRQVVLSSGAYRLIDGCTLAVSTPSGYDPAAGKLSISLTGLKDLKGADIAAVDVSVTFDKSAPLLDSAGTNISVDSGTGIKLAPGTTTAIPQGENQTVINIQFSEAMDFPATQSRIQSWIKITGANSGDVSFTVTRQGDKGLQILISSKLADDSYTLTLSENFTDKSGLALADSAQTLKFAVNSGAVMPVPALKPILIDGARAYQCSVSGNISGTETDTFSMTLPGGNSYSVYAIPTDASLNLQLFDSSANLASKTTGAYWDCICYSENVLVNAETEIEISVKGLNSTTGNYILLVVVNGVADINPTDSSTRASSSSVTGPQSPYNWASSMECSVTSFWGNISKLGVSATKNLTLTVAKNETFSLTLDLGSGSGGQIAVYSDSSRTTKVAEGRMTDSGLIVIDSILASQTTYYVQLTGLTSEYQLTAVKNGILNVELGSSDYAVEDLQGAGHIVSNADNYVRTSVFGEVSQIPGSISVNNMKELVKASSDSTQTAVTASVSGRWAMIGAVNRTTGVGCVYAYNLQGDEWVYVSTLTQTGKSALGFGASVSVDGEYLAVGASEAKVNAGVSGAETSCGTVYLYKYSGSGWTAMTTVIASDAVNGMNFGHSVAISGGQLAVGASQARDLQNVCGAVYLFSITESGGKITATQTQRLLADRMLEVGNRDSSVSIGYGSCVDMDGDLLLVGSPSDLIDNTGSAFVYQYDGLRWNLISVLSPSSGSYALESGDGFGSQVCLSGGYAAISAPGAGNSGRVYIYSVSDLLEKVNNIGLSVQPTVIESNSVQTTIFGSSLSFSRGQLYVGGFSGTSNAAALWSYGLSSSGVWSANSSNSQLFSDGAVTVAAYDSGCFVINSETGKTYCYHNSADSDRFTFTTNADGNIVYKLNSQSPAGSLGAGNISASVYDSKGNLVSFSYDSSTGKYTSDNSCVAGQYTVYIYASSGISGDYVLRVYSALNESVKSESLKVQTVLNGREGYVKSLPGYITVQFNHNLNLQTLSTAISSGQILINSAAVSAYEVIDGATIRFKIPNDAQANAKGEYLLTFNGNGGATSSLKSTFGGGIGADQKAVLTVDSTAITPSINIVATATATADAIIELNLGADRLRGTIDLSQLQLVGAYHGEIALNGAYATQRDGIWYLTLQTKNLPDDLYTLTFKTSEYALADMAGNLINNGLSDWSITFEANYSGVQTVKYSSNDSAESDFVKLGDESSVAYKAQLGGYLKADQTDTYEVSIPGCHSLLVFLSGDTRETTTLSFKRGGAAVSYEVIRTDTGMYALLYYRNDSTFQISVSNSGGSGGAVYSLDLYLNCQTELEMAASGKNDSRETAENLSVMENSITSGKSLYQTEVGGILGSDQDVDWYKFSLNDGECFNFYLNSTSGQKVSLELYNSSGVKIISGYSSDAWQQMISSFIEFSVGEEHVYYLRVSGLAGGYTLHALRNLDISANGQTTEVNSKESAIGTVSGTQQSATSGSSFLLHSTICSDELTRGALYGAEIDVDGDLLIVGAPKGSVSEINEGFAAVYRFRESQWVLESSLKAPTSDFDDCFGSAVSIQGNLAVVSAVGVANGISSGQAFIYEYKNGAWTYSYTLKSSGDSNYVFGSNVTIIDDSTILAAGTQEVLIFRKSFSTTVNAYVWSVSGSDRISAPATYYARGFGDSVAVNVSDSQTTLVIGAPASTAGGNENSGLAFVYVRANTSAYWELKSVLSLADNSLYSGTQSNAGFGGSVAVDDNWIAVGITGNVGQSGQSGQADTNQAIYLYKINNGTVSFFQTLDETSPDAQFAASLSLSDNYLAVGSPDHNSCGSVDVYFFNGITWSKIQQITSSEKSGAFGSGIVLADGQLIVGAPGQTNSQSANQTRSGLVYTYALAQSNEYSIQVQSGQAVQIQFSALKTPDNSLTGVKYQYKSADDPNAAWISVTGSTFTPGFTGDCLVLLTGTSGVGEYAVSFTGTTDSSVLSAPTASIPSGTELNPFEGATSIQFTFDEPIRLDYLTETAIGVDGGLGSKYVSKGNWSISEDGKTLLVTIVQQSRADYISNQMTVSLDKDCFISLSGKRLGAISSFAYTVPIETVQTLVQTKVSEATGESNASVQISIEFDKPMKVVAGSATSSSTQSVTDNLGWKEVVSVQYYDGDNVSHTVSVAEIDGAVAQYDSETQTLDVQFDPAKLEGAGKLFTVSLNALKVVAEDGTYLNNIEQMSYNVPIVNSSSIDDNMKVLSAVTTNSTAGVSCQGNIWVDEWSSIWVEIWGQAGSSGIGTVSLQVANKGTLYQWATENGQLVVEAGSYFQGNSGTLTCVQNGKTLTLTGTASQAGVGADGSVLIARVKCVPVGNNTVPLSTLDKEGSFLETGIQVYGQGLAVDKSANALNITVSGSNAKVTPVSYDLNDDGAVNMSDFISFATLFNSAATQGSKSYYADFNRDGTVNMADFILFAQNFNTGFSMGSKVTYSSDYINWLNSYVKGETASPSAAEAELASLDAVETITAVAAESVVSESVVSESVVSEAVAETAESNSVVDLSLTGESDELELPSAISGVLFNVRTIGGSEVQVQNRPILLNSTGEEVVSPAEAVSDQDQTIPEVRLNPRAQNVSGETTVKTLEIKLSPVALQSRQTVSSGTGTITGITSGEQTGIISHLTLPVTVMYRRLGDFEFPEIAPMENHTDLIFASPQEQKKGTASSDWLSLPIFLNEDSVNRRTSSPTDELLKQYDWEWLEKPDDTDGDDEPDSFNGSEE